MGLDLSLNLRSLIFGGVIALALSLSACSKSSESGSGLDGRISPTFQGPSEPTYCGTAVGISGSTVTLTGTAMYQAREVFSTGSGGLGGAGAAKPIRFVEVWATSSSGSLIQCGETNVSGQFSLTVPRGASLNISVRSRAFNSNVKASVLDAPEKNKVYSLSQSVTADTSKSIGTLTAGVDDQILGAPFNILDQILATNIYLRAQVGTCAIAGCANFTVAPKVTAYWEKGFNPNSYFDDSQGISFYLPGYSRLFILGGIDGDVNSSDTDHFDNTIIIHEYGHFIEDTMTQSDSPGGPHDGNGLIDPRLAWSEAWGNFIQAVVLNNPRYIDTKGNSSGSTRFLFNVNLEDKTGSGSKDNPQFTGEGNFREFSVTRFLWDAIDTGGSNDEAISGGFPQIWASLVRAIDGFRNPNAAFRSLGLFNFIQQTQINQEDWSSLRTLEMQTQASDEFLREYAFYVDNTGGCAANNFSITPYDDPTTDPSDIATSNLLRNNDFFHYKHPGGTVTFRMNYTVAGGAAVETDMDLYIYNSKARFGVSTDVGGRFSERTPDGNNATPEYETVTATNLAAGDYLINVFVFTGTAISATPIAFELLANGVRLCPAPQP